MIRPSARSVLAARAARAWAIAGALGAGALGAVACALGPVGCAQLDAAPPPPFKVELRVTSDPEEPLRGAQVLYGGREVASTGPAGLAQLTLRGNEGDSYDLFVKCPTDFQSPTKPLTVFLRRVAGDQGKLPRYEVACPPTKRTVVVVVRAENGPNLPVLYLGQPVARTDASGAAIVMLKLEPTAPFELTLGTAAASGAAKEAELLRPQNPTASFVVKPHDDVVVFDQRFSVEKRPVLVAPAAPDRRPRRI